jgi:alanine racemase
MQKEPTIAEVDLNALRHNLRQIRTLLSPRCSILGVVKANAYGHGAVLISRALVEEGVSMLGVGRVAEGIELRKAGIRARILLLGGALEDAADEIVRHDLRPVVYDLPSIAALHRAARGQRRTVHVHVKVDTGMSRLGFSIEHVAKAMTDIGKHKSIKIEGLLTHFAAADTDPRFTIEQLRRFQAVREELRTHGLSSLITHAANSAAILQCPDAHFDLVRPGILLYGYTPSVGIRHSLDLKPVLKWKTRIAQIRTLPRGATVSYSRTFTTNRETRIAILPVGYADGFRRSFPDSGEVLLHGRRAIVVGAVCMDLMMVDITDHGAVEVGDEVVLMGEQGGESASVWSLAERLGTIPYEVLCMISSRVPRVKRPEPSSAMTKKGRP